jgi:hypothetical protein
MVVFAGIVRLEKCLGFEVADIFAYDVEGNSNNVHRGTWRVEEGSAFRGTSRVAMENNGRFCDCPRQKRLYWRRNSTCFDFGASQEICPLNRPACATALAPLQPLQPLFADEPRFVHCFAIRPHVALGLCACSSGSREMWLVRVWGSRPWPFAAVLKCMGVRPDSEMSSAMPRDSSSPHSTSLLQLA